MDHWVYDIETLSNCFVVCFEHYTADEEKVFVVHELENEFSKLLEFLKKAKKEGSRFIGFNNLAFDGQIVEHILREEKKLVDLSADALAQAFYAKAQDIITRQNGNQFQEFSERNMSIKQIDVFKLNHWDNPAKRSSLKWIQYTMDWKNIQEMPIHHGAHIKSAVEIAEIIKYCKNDVKSTKAIMHKSKGLINLRNTLSKEYDIDLYNASEPRISKELFMLFLSSVTGIPKYELRQLRTNREYIAVSDIILPYVKFEIPELQDMLDNFKAVVIKPENTKGGFKYTVKHNGVTIDFGQGGVHGLRASGIYEPKENEIIITSDVTSFYPNLAIRNKWSPGHLPKEEFCKQYEWFFEERKKIPKKDPKNYVFKIILNSTFGLSIDKNSFLYDPQLGMAITINGQLTLMMLYEMVSVAIPEAIPIMVNTDGMEFIIPKDKKDKYLEVCRDWEKITQLQLEHDEYKRMFVGDVNNYIGVYTDPAKKPKCKGRFDFEDLALHKNKSCLIIPKAIYHYFINDIPPERYLIENRNIFDYCAGVKISAGWECKQLCYTKSGMVITDVQKTVRYYISEKGCKLIKVNKEDGREINLEAGPWQQTVFNEYKELPWDQYQVNDAYYLDRIYKEIYHISPKSDQLSLF